LKKKRIVAEERERERKRENKKRCGKKLIFGISCILEILFQNTHLGTYTFWKVCS